MINIWICDDNKKMLFLIGEFVKRYFRTKKESAFIEEYFNGKEVIDIIQKENKAPDILFIAIKMRMISGYKVAGELKKYHCRTLLIFVTAFEELFFDALKYKPFGYILKSALNKEINYYIDKAVKRLSIGGIHSLELKNKGMIINIDYDAIILISSLNKKTIIELYNGDIIDTRIALRELATKTSETSLVMISRSMIINLKYILEVSGRMALLPDGRKVRVSRRKYSAFKWKRNQYASK